MVINFIKHPPFTIKLFLVFQDFFINQIGLQNIFIINMNNLSDSNFIFGDIEEESQHHWQQRKGFQMPKQQLQYSNHVENKMNKQQDQAKSNAFSHTHIESKLIIVQPTNLSKIDHEEEQLEVIQLPSKNKEYPLVENQKNTVKEKEEIIFPYEQSQELEDEPQSSIRKLYKAMKRQQKQIKHENDNKVEFNEQQDHFYQQQQQSASDQSQQYEQKTQIRSNSLRKLVLFKVPQKKSIKCLVKIANDSFFSLQTVFHFYLVQQKQLLMTARKKRFRISSKYQIFGKEKGHVQRLAIARSNYSRTQYKLSVLRKKDEEKQESTAFTSSIIKMTKIVQQTKQPTYIEDQKCYLCYESNFFGLTQQKVDIIKPRKLIAKTDRFSDIKSTYENCQFERIQKFGNRLAQRNHEGKLIMDFKDDKICYSAKNMIVESELGEACLVFGKRRDDIFSIDIMSPFNFLEGFFVAICNLDRKLFVY